MPLKLPKVSESTLSSVPVGVKLVLSPRGGLVAGIKTSPLSESTEIVRVVRSTRLPRMGPNVLLNTFTSNVRCSRCSVETLVPDEFSYTFPVPGVGFRPQFVPLPVPRSLW